MPQVEHLVHFSQQVLSRFEKRNLVPDILCKMLLNDMAPNGRALEYVQLPPNVLGLRIGIIGAKLYFQATYDSSQPDCLRVISVAPIDSAPKDVPRKSSEAKYTLPKRKDELNPSLGSVHHLFRSDGIGEQQTTLPQKHEAGTAERLHAVELDPSELLLQKLRQSAPVSIQHWRPQLEEKSSLSDAQFLKLLRVPWQKLRLANYIRLSAKQASYLSGQVPKSELSLDAREQMLEAFGMRMLNNAASRLNIADDQVADILSSLERVPLGEALRCGIWSALARLLQTDRFLVELQTVGKLLCGDDGRPPDRSVWIDAICATLEWRDGHGKPDGLKELGNKIRVSQTPARTLLDAVAITNIPVTEEANGQTLPVVPRIQAMPNSSVLQAVSVANDDQQAKTESTDHTERAFDIYGWVVRSMGWGAESYGELTEEILHLINNQTKSLEKLKRKSDWQKLTLLLFELSEKVKEWSSLLPDPSLLDSNLDPAIRAFDLARSILGEDASRVIQGSVATPSDVLEACQVMSHFDQLQRLPKWIWGTYPEGVLTKPEAFTVLTKSESREKVSGIVDIIQQRNDVSDLWLAAMPTPGQPMDEISLFQLEEYVTAYLDEVTLLSVRLPQEVLASALQRNGGRPTAELLKNTLAMMSMFNGRTSEETTTAILCEVIGIEDEASAAATAERYQSALEFFEDKFGATIMPVFEQLKQLASSSTVRNISAESAIEAHRSPTAFVTLENNWIDLHGTKAPIGFCRYPEHAGKAYGYVSVPLVAVSRQRIEVNYKLCFETSSPLHNPWPAEWDSTCPGELSIRQDDWRSSLEHHDRFFYSFKYTIPVRDPKNVKNTPSKLEFSLKLLDADTNVIVGKPTKFSWSDISAPIGLPETISWPQGVDISNVEKHPLGPQKFKSEILARVVSMSSFAVIAPRRFGKSTLLEFVEHKVQEDGFLVVRIDCTSYNGGAGHFAHWDLWSQISKELQNATGASITLDSPADILPQESAFDFVKKAAAKSGYKGIVLLFDESQLFFNVKDGTILGDRLKGRIERSWSRNLIGAVPILFGFIGLRSLRERAGANLCGLLEPFNTNELDEAEINSLILAVTSGKLRTTREARIYLARVTGNLYILRVLVNKLYKLIKGEGRAWANYDDVYAIEKTVSRNLSEGGEEDVANYIKDVLNDAQDVNYWLPNPAILLAIAIAESMHAAQDEYEPKHAIRIIDQWCKRASSAKDIRLVYTEEQYRHQMTILEERGAIRGLSFSSPLLEAWLRIGPNIIKDQFEEILMRSAAHRIKLPHPTDETFVQDGSEATIRIVMIGDTRYAYRTVALPDKDSRERFYKCQEILEKLKEKAKTRKAGSEYIFNLYEVGIADDNENMAVQIYQWVEGQDLTSSIGRLSAEYVADLGLKLSKGLHFLHSEEILHRDIAPRNIVVSDQSGEPVIIDFGFAKKYSSESFTRVEGDYAAPEVSGNICTWSTAADIYSLGSTLNKLLVADCTYKPLREVLQQCLALDIRKRPAAHALVVKFQEVSDELKISYRKDAMWKRVQDASLRETKAHPWYEGIVEKFRVSFNAASLGCMGTTFDRTKRVAAFLAQVFEAYNSAHGKRDLKLGICASGGTNTALALATVEMKFIADLRNDHSHGGYRANNARNAQNGIITDEKMLKMAMKAAQQMGDYVHLSSLIGLTELLVEPSKNLSI